MRPAPLPERTSPKPPPPLCGRCPAGRRVRGGGAAPVAKGPNDSPAAAATAAVSAFAQVPHALAMQGVGRDGTKQSWSQSRPDTFHRDDRVRSQWFENYKKGGEKCRLERSSSMTCRSLTRIERVSRCLSNPTTEECRALTSPEFDHDNDKATLMPQCISSLPSLEDDPDDAIEFEIISMERQKLMHAYKLSLSQRPEDKVAHNQRVSSPTTHSGTALKKNTMVSFIEGPQSCIKDYSSEEEEQSIKQFYPSSLHSSHLNTAQGINHERQLQDTFPVATKTAISHCNDASLTSHAKASNSSPNEVMQPVTQMTPLALNKENKTSQNSSDTSSIQYKEKELHSNHPYNEEAYTSQDTMENYKLGDAVYSSKKTPCVTALHCVAELQEDCVATGKEENAVCIERAVAESVKNSDYSACESGAVCGGSVVLRNMTHELRDYDDGLKELEPSQEKVNKSCGMVCDAKKNDDQYTKGNSSCKLNAVRTSVRVEDRDGLHCNVEMKPMYTNDDSSRTECGGGTTGVVNGDVSIEVTLKESSRDIFDMRSLPREMVSEDELCKAEDLNVSLAVDQLGDTASGALHIGLVRAVLKKEKFSEDAAVLLDVGVGSSGANAESECQECILLSPVRDADLRRSRKVNVQTFVEVEQQQGPLNNFDLLNSDPFPTVLRASETVDAISPNIRTPELCAAAAAVVDPAQEPVTSPLLDSSEAISAGEPVSKASLSNVPVHPAIKATYRTRSISHGELLGTDSDEERENASKNIFWGCLAPFARCMRGAMRQ